MLVSVPLRVLLLGKDKVIRDWALLRGWLLRDLCEAYAALLQARQPVILELSVCSLAGGYIDQLDRN